MKYYVTSDVHGYDSILRQALADAGFFEEKEPHRLVILGDLFDRGEEARSLQDFVLRLMEEDRIILIRGNHEDLFETFVMEDCGRPYSVHVQNGTYDTAIQLTGCDPIQREMRWYEFADAAMQTPYYRTIIPAMRDYWETENYVFVHGWIPCGYERGRYKYDPDWRGADAAGWMEARWTNGMEAARTCREEKTILCGHWHASYGHARFERKGAEFGPRADFSPYYGKGIIALDACTAASRKVNVIVLED